MTGDAGQGEQYVSGDIGADGDASQEAMDTDDISAQQVRTDIRPKEKNWLFGVSRPTLDFFQLLKENLKKKKKKKNGENLSKSVER